jgi:hypothetical protein
MTSTIKNVVLNVSIKSSESFPASTRHAYGRWEPAHEDYQVKRSSSTDP